MHATQYGTYNGTTLETTPILLPTTTTTTANASLHLSLRRRLRRGCLQVLVPVAVDLLRAVELGVDRVKLALDLLTGRNPKDTKEAFQTHTRKARVNSRPMRGGLGGGVVAGR